MPGAWGAGKSTLNYAIAKYSNADVVVFVACGERSVEFVDNVKGYEYVWIPPSLHFSLSISLSRSRVLSSLSLSLFSLSLSLSSL